MKFVLLCQLQPSECAQVSEAVPHQMQQGREAIKQEGAAGQELQAAGQPAIPHQAQRIKPIAGVLNEIPNLMLDGESQIGGCHVPALGGVSEAMARHSRCCPANFGAENPGHSDLIAI